MKQDQLEWMVAMARIVVEGKETPEAVAKCIGETRTTAGEVIYVNPSDPRYSSATVVFDEKTHRIHSLGIRVADGQHLPSVAEFEARFGAYSGGGRSHFRAPIELSFSVDFGASFQKTATIIAYVNNDHEPKNQWRVESVTVLAEVRL